ncbi:glycosyltransferase family 4 protein [Pedobacter sp. Leaf176]|uniref:glycosyltransferase family 4 protein n=1 Tax=Pedobacter sp. Leaf176 TaxID=1736286 RepID=UPI0006F519BB|nr:glycosyltransferase family 4 protein [Pedobacter sp. Leaf176]KQR72699.1 hypothetical protein ASF92_05340 [Pedobacter sp. Leaf176]
MKNKEILFLSLYTFGLTGGIENVCRVFIHALEDLGSQNKINDFKALSLYDNSSSTENYIGFGGNKPLFSLSVVKNAIQAEVVILSHINLLPFAKLIRIIYPRKRIILFAHGIEVWRPLSSWRRKLLNKIELWAVSRYTASVLKSSQGISEKNIHILNNALPRSFNFRLKPTHQLKPLEKYGVPTVNRVLLTVCRLSSSEKYKGYDIVLQALKHLIKIHPQISYLLVGQADAIEQQRVEALIADGNLQENVILTGFVPDSELELLYQSAEIFVMPSHGEGFGLVFIEAAAHGCQILAGNADGSTDAVLDGNLALIINPDDPEAVYTGLIHLLESPLSIESKLARLELVKAHFGFESYLVKVDRLLNRQPLF